MKRVILFLMILVLTVTFVHPTFAQGKRDKTKFNWGVMAGVNWSNATGTWVDIIGYDRKWDTGLTAGLTGAINLNNHFAVRSELLIVRRGFILEGDNTQLARELNPFAIYTEIPVLLEWDLLPYSYVRPHILAGPSFGFLISDGVGIEVPGVRRAKARELTNMSGTDFSFVVGIRMSFPARRDRGYIEVRYQQGISNFLDDVGTENLLINDDGSAVTFGGPGSPDAKHQVISIVMGLIID